MSTPASPSSEPLNAAPHLKPLSSFVWWVRECVAVGAWVLVVVRLFVRIDLTPVMFLPPSVTPALHSRSLIVLGSLAALWLFLYNQRFFRFVGYVVGFPLVVLLWKMPRILVRNWAVTIAFSPALHSLATTSRQSFITFTAALVAALLIQLGDIARWALAAAVIYLASYLVFHYIRRLRIAFISQSVFSDIVGWIRRVWSRIEQSTLPPLEGIDPSSEEYKQKRNQHLLMLYTMVTMLHFLAARLRDVVASRKLDLYFLASLLYTACVTTVVFAFIYQGVERLVPGSFHANANDTMSFWSFLGYSFSTLVTSNISPLSPAGTAARAFSYAQALSGPLLAVSFVFVMFTSTRERYIDDARSVAEELRIAAKRFANQIQMQYGLTTLAAKGILVAIHPDTVRWLIGLYDPETIPAIEGPRDEERKG